MSCKVAILLAKNIDEHKDKLKFFMQKFCSIIKTMDSTHKELSIAIRGYGFFAGVRWSSGKFISFHPQFVLLRLFQTSFITVALQRGLPAGRGLDVHGVDPAVQADVPDWVGWWRGQFLPAAELPGLHRQCLGSPGQGKRPAGAGKSQPKVEDGHFFKEIFKYKLLRLRREVFCYIDYIVF